MLIGHVQRYLLQYDYLIARCRHLRSPHHVSKDDDQRLEHQAVELLEAAMKILASPSSCVGRRARPSDGPTATEAAAQSMNEPDSQEDALRRRQVCGRRGITSAAITLKHRPVSRRTSNRSHESSRWRSNIYMHARRGALVV